MSDKILKSLPESVLLYPGIELTYVESGYDAKKQGDYMISYCQSGQMEWETEGSKRLYLNPGDFILHTGGAAGFPTGRYSGLNISIDLKEITAHPPEVLKDESFFKSMGKDDTTFSFAGNEQTESIFSAFYGQPRSLKLAYQKIKTIELLLYISKSNLTSQNKADSLQSEQAETIRKIHDKLTGHMDERITIEELSREYLINPTTLKAAFKSVYGMSIAAHMKKYRMEQAAKLLKESDMSIAKIAEAVGYDSQSKFTASFKAFYHVLPREYKKMK